MERIEDFINFDRKSSALYKLSRLVNTIFIVAHWIACIFHMIGFAEIPEGHSWIHDANLINANNFERYIASLYWSITTMTTVGYGDIGPVTGVERFFTILAMLVACALFGYSLNLVG